MSDDTTPGSPGLRSHWVFVYSGDTRGIAIRKIERFLQRTLIDPSSREDWPHADGRRPMIEALIASGHARWEDALRDTLLLARRFDPRWEIDLYDVDGDVLGTAARSDAGRLAGGPSCLLRVIWRLRRDQGYVRFTPQQPARG